jgi:nucleolar GTP-binding protein
MRRKPVSRATRARRRPVRVSKGREDRGAARASAPGAPESARILDAAFRRAYRATPHGASRVERSRRRALLKIVRSSAVVLRQLALVGRPFQRPGLSAFESKLVDRAFGEGTLDRSLRRIGRAQERIRGLRRDAERALARTQGEEEFAESVRAFYGRLASFTREVDADLTRLRRVRRFLQERPSLTADEPTLVVAGFPNVGKSSLVARLSSAHPKVADYPFTTRALEVGHANLGFDRLQVLDTPGVLGRAGRANPAEVEAETAVRFASTILLFVLDPSESCGYPLSEQLALLARWRAEFPDLPILEVETKADLRRSDSDRLKVSASTGEGIGELEGAIGSAMRARRRAEPMPPIQDATVEPAGSS